MPLYLDRNKLVVKSIFLLYSPSEFNQLLPPSAYNISEILPCADSGASWGASSSTLKNNLSKLPIKLLQFSMPSCKMILIWIRESRKITRGSASPHHIAGHKTSLFFLWAVYFTAFSDSWRRINGGRCEFRCFGCEFRWLGEITYPHNQMRSAKKAQPKKRTVWKYAFLAAFFYVPATSERRLNNVLSRTYTCACGRLENAAWRLLWRTLLLFSKLHFRAFLAVLSAKIRQSIYRFYYPTMLLSCLLIL